MAHYHCSYGKCNKSRGSSAAAAYDYITRSRKYSGKQGLLYFESGNLPKWCGGRAREYWYQADRNERANSNVARKLEFALPNEVEDLEFQKRLVRDVIDKVCRGDKLMWSYAIHTTATGNIHAHVMISERLQDNIVRTPEQFFRRANKKNPKKGGCSKTEFLKKKEFVPYIREQVATLINRLYQRLGIDVSVDHRSYAARGILKIPEAHRGPQLAEMEDRGMVSYVLADRREKIIDQQRALISDVEFERDGILAELKHLTDQLALWDRSFGDAHEYKHEHIKRPAAPVFHKETPRPIPIKTTVKVYTEQKKKYKVDDDFSINVDLLNTVADDDVDGDLMKEYDSFVAQSAMSKDDWDSVDGDLMKELEDEAVPAPAEQRPASASIHNDFWTDFDDEEDLPLAPSSKPATTSLAQIEPCSAEMLSTPSLTPEQLADRQYADKAVKLSMGEYEGTVLAYGEHDLYLCTAGKIIRIPRIAERDVPSDLLPDYHAIYAPIGSHIHITYDAHGLNPVRGGDDDDQYLGLW